jgi:hypothetical protein
LRDKKGDIVMGENAICVRMAKVFQDMGMFTGIVDRVRKVGRETLYHVLYDDGDE